MAAIRNRISYAVLGVVLAVGGLNAPGRAEILDIRAEIAAKAEEYADDALVSSDAAFEQFPETQSGFPLEVGVVLGNPGDLTDVAFAFTDFRDPTRPTGSANPAEFGLETTCVSRGPATAYSVQSEAVETRTIRLTAGDLGLSFGQSRASSEIFLSGALILWTQDSGRDLRGLEAEIQVTVYRVAGASVSTELFSTGLRLSGTAEGRVTAAPLGSLVYEFGGSELLFSNTSSAAGPVSCGSDPESGHHLRVRRSDGPADDSGSSLPHPRQEPAGWHRRRLCLRAAVHRAQRGVRGRDELGRGGGGPGRRERGTGITERVHGVGAIVSRTQVGLWCIRGRTGADGSVVCWGLPIAPGPAACN